MRTSSCARTRREISCALSSASFNGGFLQADYHASDWIALTLRGNLLNPPRASDGSRETVTSVFPGVQVWIFRRLKLSAQYGFQSGDAPDGGAVQVDLAF